MIFYIIFRALFDQFYCGRSSSEPWSELGSHLSRWLAPFYEEVPKNYQKIIESCAFQKFLYEFPWLFVMYVIIQLPYLIPSYTIYINVLFWTINMSFPYSLCS